MKSGLFYVLLVVFSLMLVYSAQSNEKQTYGDLSTCQSVNVSNNIDFIIPQIKFSLKKNLPELNQFRLINEKLFRNNYNRKKILSSTFQRLGQLRAVDLKPILQIPFRQLLYYSAEKQDNYHLSI